MDIKEILNLDLDSLLKEFQRITGISQNGISKAIEGISAAQISLLKNGKYDDVNKAEEKIRIYIKNELEKILETKEVDLKICFPFIKDVSGSINKGVFKNKIVLLRGDSGSGKTTMLKAFRKEYPNNTFVQAYKGMKKSELMRLVSGSKETSIQKIKPLVKEKILILDEANKLSGGTLEWLRSLHDMTGMPMIWAGTYEDIDDVLYKQPELNRRCRKVYMPNLNDSELQTLVDKYEFSQPKEYKKILQERFKGNLALCVETLNEMKEFVTKNNSTDNVATFLRAVETIE